METILLGLMFLGLIISSLILSVGNIKKNSKIYRVVMGLFVIFFLGLLFGDGTGILIFNGPYILAIILLISGIKNKSSKLGISAMLLFALWTLLLFFSGAMFFN